MEDGLERAEHYGVRWQAKRDTAFSLDDNKAGQDLNDGRGCAKAPSPLRSAGALQNLASDPTDLARLVGTTLLRIADPRQ